MSTWELFLADQDTKAIVLLVGVVAGFIIASLLIRLAGRLVRR